MATKTNEFSKEVIAKMYELFNKDQSSIDYNNCRNNKGVGLTIRHLNGELDCSFMDYKGNVVEILTGLSNGSISIAASDKEYIETCNRIIKYFLNLKDSVIESYDNQVFSIQNKFEYEFNVHISNINYYDERKDSKKQFTFFVLHFVGDKQMVYDVTNNTKVILHSKENKLSPRVKECEFHNELRYKLANLPKEEVVKLFDLLETPELIKILLDRVDSKKMANKMNDSKTLIKK